MSAGLRLALCGRHAMQTYYEAFQVGGEMEVQSQAGESVAQSLPELQESWEWSPLSWGRSKWQSSGHWSEAEWEDWERWQQVRSRWMSRDGSGGQWSWAPTEEPPGRGSGRALSMSDRGQQGSNVSVRLSGGARLPDGFNRHGDLPNGEPRLSGGCPGQDEEEMVEDAEKPKHSGKVTSSYPPIFRAKAGESDREWKRSVEFWLGGEGEQLPLIYRGPRLMVQLRDRAAQLVRHLTLDQVRRPQGMELIFRTLEASPLVKQLDKHRVDQHRRRLMQLDRTPGESLESYLTRGSIYRTQLEGLDSGLAMGEKFYIGHLLDHARLTRRDKAMVRTRAGEETEGNVVAALLELAAELEGENGFPIGVSEPNMGGQDGEEHLIQKSTTYRKPSAPKAALAAVSEEVDETFSTIADEGTESVDAESFPELMEAEKEAYAMQYKAKQRMAEVKKMRNFYQKKDPEERKRLIAEKMKETHCHSCGEKGHWSRECPKNRAQQVLMASSRRKLEENLKGIPEHESEWDLLVSLCTDQQHPKSSGVYMAFPCVMDGARLSMHSGSEKGDDVGFDVLWNLTELRQGVILDLGCMKSVAGTGWANQLVKQWRTNGWWFKVVPESEQFRFGNGSTLKSKFSLQFLGTFAGRLVVFAFSVVSGDCPPLLSQPACSALGLTLDCTYHSMSSRSLKVKNYGLKQTLSGHYMMNIGEFEKAEVWEVPDDFCLKVGEEVMIVPSASAALFQDQDSDHDSDGPSNVHLGRRGLRLGTSPVPDLLRIRPSYEEMPAEMGQSGRRDGALRGAAEGLPPAARGGGAYVRGVISQSEKEGNAYNPKRIWVRIRGKLKVYPLEKIRLATADEMVSAEYITNALLDVQKELDEGRLQVVESVRAIKDKEEKKRKPRTSTKKRKGQIEDRPLLERRQSSRPAEKAILRAQEGEEEVREKKQRRLECLEDVPLQMRSEPRAKPEQDPSGLPFTKKQRMFEEMSKQYSAKSTLEEAELRSTLEEAVQKMKVLRKTIRKNAKEKARCAASQPEEGDVNFVYWADNYDGEEVVQELEKFPDEFWQEMEVMEILWSEGPNVQMDQSQLQKWIDQVAVEDERDVFQAELVTGKLRVELQWKGLDEKWRAAFREPLIKAVRTYFDHEAIEGVPKDAVVDPRKVLTSRFVLTNKGEPILELAELKARWILGGHRDAELGNYATMAPTSALLGHNLLNFLAVQFGWVVHYEDVSAAFLQGKKLPTEREVYVKVPHGYPDYVTQYIREMVGEHCRWDMLKLLKGGFGLAESPRLWYLEYKATLKDIGLHELRLMPGMFRCFHPDGRLRALVCIHVDDTRYAGDETAQELWDELHRRLKFGTCRSAVEGWQKFCGRWEKQDPETKEFFYSMVDYIKKIDDIPLELYRNPKDEMTEHDKKLAASVLGQLNWAARQGRYDLSYGVSHCQQLVGIGKKEALEWTQKLVRRAKQEKVMKVSKLGCSLDEMLVISASDAAYAAQPKAASQGGVTCVLAHPQVLQGNGPVAILEAQSMKIARVVRCSMSAELSMAATAFEHGDFLRALIAEVLKQNFVLQEWKWWASHWKHYLVIDAKTGYDVLNSEVTTSDRKIMIDAAVLREAITSEESQNFVRWMPGPSMISDGLTKWNPNHVLEQVMEQGIWSLVDTPEAQALRLAAAMRKRSYKKQTSTPMGVCVNESIG